MILFQKVYKINKRLPIVGERKTVNAVLFMKLESKDSIILLLSKYIIKTVNMNDERLNIAFCSK